MKKHSLDHTSSNTEDEKARFSLGILYKKLTVHATENRNLLSNTGIYPITFVCCNNLLDCPNPHHSHNINHYLEHKHNSAALGFIEMLIVGSACW